MESATAFARELAGTRSNGGCRRWPNDRSTTASKRDQMSATYIGQHYLLIGDLNCLHLGWLPQLLDFFYVYVTTILQIIHQLAQHQVYLTRLEAITL